MDRKGSIRQVNRYLGKMGCYESHRYNFLQLVPNHFCNYLIEVPGGRPAPQSANRVVIKTSRPTSLKDRRENVLSRGPAIPASAPEDFRTHFGEDRVENRLAGSRLAPKGRR